MAEELTLRRILRSWSPVATQQQDENPTHTATLFFSILLLLFLQTVTVWIESIYRVGLTKLALGWEASGLVSVLSPLVLFVVPERAQRKLLWGSVVVFLLGRGLLPMVGLTAGVLLGGISVGAFLVCLCLLLSRPFSFLLGNGGVALGLALLMSIALRAWGATYDLTLGHSGAALGWGLAALALGLFWKLARAAKVEIGSEHLPAGGLLVPVLGLSASLAVGYLILSSPGVVEGWLGFDNTLGLVLCLVALGVALIALGRGVRVAASGLTVWNLLFGAALISGIMALRVTFPPTPESPAVIVCPENSAARRWLNLMLLLSPVVLFNVQAVCRRLGEIGRARSLAGPLVLGMFAFVLLTLMSIFTNVWGYVGPVSMGFRNQFHLPFLLGTILMVGSGLRADRRPGLEKLEARPEGRLLAGLAVLLVLCAIVGVWSCRPLAVGAKAGGGNARRLTILSYNLQQGSALDGTRNWENQLALIKTINPDIIGLQESDTARPSQGNVVAAKYFGARLGYHIYYGPNTVSGSYGTAILSRFPLKKPRTVFTYSDQDEVGTAVAEFELEGKTFGFFNSHPSGNDPRESHAKELVRQTMPYDYVIAVGDYNTTPQQSAYRTIVAQLKDSWAECHPDGVGPLPLELRPRGTIRPHGSSGQVSTGGDHIAMPNRIDHIFLSKALKAVESFYLPAPASQTDHPAHWTVAAWD